MKPQKPLSLTPKQYETVQKAMALQQSGQLAAAAGQYKKLLPALSTHTTLLNNLGTIAIQLGQHAEGLKYLHRSLQIDANQPQTLNNCGVALAELKRWEEALSRYDQAMALNPADAATFNNRGGSLLALKLFTAALDSFEQAIALNPSFSDAYSNRGAVQKELNRPEEALHSCEQAIRLNPRFAKAYANRGNALKDLNRLDEALHSYQQAIAINPNHAETHYNLGNTLKELNRLDEALSSYDKATQLNPDYAEAYWNKALLHILKGHYAEGWALYEWGAKCQHRQTARTHQQPVWLGQQALAGKTLLIHPEQGLGDYIQFMRYAALAEQMGAKVILEVPAPLLGLVTTFKGNFTLIEAGLTLPEFDYHCPLMSLPLAFKTTLETIPAQIPYLYPAPEKQHFWQQRLGDKSKPRVGLVWSGSSTHKNDHNRSIPLAQLAPLFSLPIEYHCLQKEIRPEDGQFIAESNSINTHSDLLADFTDTAALLAAMDLVISVDTSVAHLGGSLGQQVWILLPYIPDYRWLQDRADSPWYPNARLFRQPARNDWASVAQQLAEQLHCLL